VVTNGIFLEPVASSNITNLGDLIEKQTITKNQSQQTQKNIKSNCNSSNFIDTILKPIQ
jgi:hypothetical protein